MKKVFVFLIITLISSLSIQVVLTSSHEEGPVPGEFTSTGFNNPVEIDQFVFKDNTGLSINSGASLNPQNIYYFKLDITDHDTVADLDQVQVIFYDNSVTFGDSLTTSDEGDVVVFEWDKDDSLSQGGEMGILKNSTLAVSHSGITWEIISSTAPALSADENLTQVSFEVSFKISKVADEGTNNWTFGFNIDDGVENPTAANKNVSNASIQTVVNPEGASHTYDMAWYGEIEVPSGPIQWSSITPGIDFGDANSDATITGFTFISNGDFYEEVAVEQVWNASGAAVANVTSASLAVSTDITNNNPAQTFAVQVESSEIVPNLGQAYSNQLQINTGLATTESGTTRDYTLSLKTTTNLQNATYSGSIKFVIANN